MFCVLLFLLLFCLIIMGILYNVHVKANTTSSSSIVSDLIDRITTRPPAIGVDVPMYASPPVFTNNFYNDLPLTSEKKTAAVAVKPAVKPAAAPDYYYHNKTTQEPQVYHIFNNVYTFEQAEPECMRRKGRLATKSEVTRAYNQGASWCSWGWTSNGHAYMPNRDRKCNASVGVLDVSTVDDTLRLGVNCFGVPQPQPQQKQKQ